VPNAATRLRYFKAIAALEKSARALPARPTWKGGMMMIIIMVLDNMTNLPYYQNELEEEQRP